MLPLNSLRKKLIDNYDGYSWDGNSRLLNPWSVFSVFKKNKFGTFWLNTGPPKFLTQLVGNDFRIHEIFRTDNFLNEKLNAVEVGNMQPLALMFQAGYLTVASKEYVDGAARYYLRFPNFEVESAVYNLILNILDETSFELTQLRQNAKALVASMVALDSAGFETAFGDILASLPL
jgi:hypothetical protein